MIEQSYADQLFKNLNETVRKAEIEFVPSDLFQAIQDALLSNNISLARAVATHSTNVLVELEEEKDWRWICMEVYRRTFYDVEEMATYMYGTKIVDSPGLLTDLTNYLAQVFTGGKPSVSGQLKEFLH